MLLLILLPGCGLLEPGGGDAYASFMFAVDVTDSRTGQPLTSPLTVAVFSAARGDSLVLYLPNGVPSTYKIPEGTNGGWGEGRYSVEVRAAGFRVWRQDQVLVEEEGRCDHARTTGVAAALIPL
jgi:hypothetical protein